MSLTIAILTFLLATFPPLLVYLAMRRQSIELSVLYDKALSNVPNTEMMVEKIGEAVAKTVSGWVAQPITEPEVKPEDIYKTSDLEDGHIYEEEVNAMMAQLDAGMGIETDE